MFGYLQQGGRAGAGLRGAGLHAQHGDPRQDWQQPACRLAQPQGSRRYHKVFFYSRCSYGWVISYHYNGTAPRLLFLLCAVRNSGHRPHSQSKLSRVPILVVQASANTETCPQGVMFDPAPSWSWVTGLRSGIPSIELGSTTMSTQRSLPGSNQRNLVT